jgi:hypothetical protein
MAVTLEPPPHEQKYEPELPSAVLPPPEVRDLPEPPKQIWRLIGPGVVGAGVGLASGEFILWPYITSQVGLIFLWGALLGVVVQWFLNMEIERYTLATGETALTGFNRYWKYWGLVFAVMVYLQNLWPGWATSSATMLTYLFGGSPTVIAVGLLVVIGAALTLAPVIYIALERLIFVKVAVIGLFVIVAAFTVINGSAWESLPDAVTSFGHVPTELGLALVMGAIAFAGAGGGQNLAQSNWIRDKGFGMGRYHPRLVSPVTGHEEAGSQTAGYVFEPTEENLARWRRWWRFANLEQASSFVLVTILTITFTSLIAFSSVFGVPSRTRSTSSRPRATSSTRSSAAGSAPCSGPSARSRCSPPRRASSTTPAGSPPTSSRPPTCAAPACRRAGSTSRSSGAWSASASSSCWLGSTSRSCCWSSRPASPGR